MSFLRNVAMAAPFIFTQTAAAEIVTYGSLQYNSDVPEVLFLTGTIKGGDSFELRRAMRDQTINLIVTASPGGNLYEGLQIAAILHDNKIGTYIPEGALLHKSADGRGSPFLEQTYPTVSVMGVPSAVKPFRTATRIWNSAT